MENTTSIINYRDTDFYKSLDSYLATAYAEGFCEGENATEEEQMIAWQYLHDTRVGYSLQGFFGRTLNELIKNGSIQK